MAVLIRYYKEAIGINLKTEFLNKELKLVLF